MAKNKPYGWTLSDQAESLEAAGLDPNTADMNFAAGTLIAVPFKETFFSDKKPCWSVGRLLSLMPRIGCCAGNLFHDDSEFYCQYMDEDGIGFEDIQCFVADDPVTPAVDMVLYLLNHNYIKKYEKDNVQ